MRYLVTGGAGFIGSHLVQALLTLGHDVTVLDDFSTGSASNLTKCGFKGDESDTRRRFVLGDVRHYDTVRYAFLKDRGIDYVFHLAAYVGVQNVLARPVEMLDVNAHGTSVVLREAFALGIPATIVSTSEVYGLSKQVPFNEEQPLVIGASTKSRWGYGVSKLMDEHLGLAYAYKSNDPKRVTVLRLFNTVGPRQVGHYGMVIPRFVGAALKGEPLQVYGNGEQTRCFCHVSDVVLAFLRTQNKGGIYNVGSTHEVQIKHLALKVLSQIGTDSKLEYVPYSEAYAASPGFEEMMRRVPDITKIRGLGWEPLKDLNYIINDVADSLR